MVVAGRKYLQFGLFVVESRSGLVALAHPCAPRHKVILTVKASYGFFRLFRIFDNRVRVEGLLPL